MRAGEARIAPKQAQIVGRLRSVLDTIPKGLHHIVLTLSHLGHLDAYVAVMYAEVGGAPGEISDARAIEHRLGRRAAVVDARAADVRALDQGSLSTSVGQR